MMEQQNTFKVFAVTYYFAKFANEKIRTIH